MLQDIPNDFNGVQSGANESVQHGCNTVDGMTYDSPSISKAAFTCPICGVLAKQDWFGTAATRRGVAPEVEGEPRMSASGNAGIVVSNLSVSSCQNCDSLHVWCGDRMCYPASSPAPLVNPDTPEAIALDYNEARDIVSLSPRSAAALLRLAIQKLCAHLGEPGKNINDDIAGLVRKGLDARVQRALDVLRVVGNESVHPGTIDLNDNPKIAESLFSFFNLIVERMISEPKHIDEVYSLLPEGKLKGIEHRDK